MTKGSSSKTHAVSDVQRFLLRGISKSTTDPRKLKIYDAIVKIKSGCLPKTACHGKMRLDDADEISNVRRSDILQFGDTIKLNVHIDYRI